MKEKIVHAACKATNGMILLGRSHADCFYQGRCIGLSIQKRSTAQGCFTNKGRYVNRAEAAIIAKKAKQIEPKRARKITHLLSEDIWYQTDRFIYIQTRGYVETLK